MAEKLCGLKKKGQKLTETSLWTNTAPSSSFTAQTISLSDDIDNYDYIGINYKDYTTGSINMRILVSPSDLKKSPGSSIMLALLTTTSSVPFTRRVGYLSNTQMTFDNAYQINATNSNNSATIPTSVVGCKFK